MTLARAGGVSRTPTYLVVATNGFEIVDFAVGVDCFAQLLLQPALSHLSDASSCASAFVTVIRPRQGSGRLGGRTPQVQVQEAEELRVPHHFPVGLGVAVILGEMAPEAAEGALRFLRGLFDVLRLWGLALGHKELLCRVPALMSLVGLAEVVLAAGDTVGVGAGLGERVEVQSHGSGRKGQLRERGCYELVIGWLMNSSFLGEREVAETEAGRMVRAIRDTRHGRLGERMVRETIEIGLLVVIGVHFLR